jgi:hypothetical protein
VNFVLSFSHRQSGRNVHSPMALPGCAFDKGHSAVSSFGGRHFSMGMEIGQDPSPMTGVGHKERFLTPRRTDGCGLG